MGLQGSGFIINGRCNVDGCLRFLRFVIEESSHCLNPHLCRTGRTSSYFSSANEDKTHVNTTERNRNKPNKDFQVPILNKNTYQLTWTNNELDIKIYVFNQIILH